MNARSMRRPPGNAGSLAPEHSAPRNGRSPDIEQVGVGPVEARPTRVDLSPEQGERFHALYRNHFDFVFRNLRRMGVPSGATDDALQEVFLVALRRIDDLHEGTSARAWLSAITLRVASTFRRTQRRRRELPALPESELRSPDAGPFELAARGEAGRVLHAFLEQLDDLNRAIFVMSELEHMTAPEMAHALSMNVNTVYSRVHIARAKFADAARELTRGSGVFRRTRQRDA